MNDEALLYGLKARLTSIEHELLLIASNLDDCQVEVLRDLTFGEIEDRYIRVTLQTSRLRLTINALTQTIEAI
jgi:hypothetical protein